jgi:hypothetical protein
MSEKRQNILFRVQLILMLAFFVGFLIWANTRCDRMREKYRDKWEERQAVLEAARQDSIAKVKAADSLAKALNENPSPAPEGPGTTVLSPRERYTPLYVTINGLNLRREPHLDSKVLIRLKLYEEVEFLNEVTDTTTRVSLGKIETDAPWIKVRSKKGQVGWVYGAGVHYYKRKQEGAI